MEDVKVDALRLADAALPAGSEGLKERLDIIRSHFDGDMEGQVDWLDGIRHGVVGYLERIFGKTSKIFPTASCLSIAIFIPLDLEMPDRHKTSWHSSHYSLRGLPVLFVIKDAGRLFLHLRYRFPILCHGLPDFILLCSASAVG